MRLMSINLTAAVANGLISSPLRKYMLQRQRAFIERTRMYDMICSRDPCVCFSSGEMVVSWSGQPTERSTDSDCQLRNATSPPQAIAQTDPVTIAHPTSSPDPTTRLEASSLAYVLSENRVVLKKAQETLTAQQTMGNILPHVCYLYFRTKPIASDNFHPSRGWEHEQPR
jgi:hypothetical protein